MACFFSLSGHVFIFLLHLKSFLIIHWTLWFSHCWESGLCSSVLRTLSFDKQLKYWRIHLIQLRLVFSFVKVGLECAYSRASVFLHLPAVSAKCLGHQQGLQHLPTLCHSPLSSQLPRSLPLPDPWSLHVHSCALVEDSREPRAGSRNPFSARLCPTVLSHKCQLPQSHKLRSLFPAVLFGFHCSYAVFWKVAIGRDLGWTWDSVKHHSPGCRSSRAWKELLPIFCSVVMAFYDGR